VPGVDVDVDGVHPDAVAEKRSTAFAPAGVDRQHRHA